MSVACKACGAPMPANAKACPGCGAAVSVKSKLVPLAAFMLIVILIIQSYMSKSEDVASEATPAVPVNSAEQ